MGWLQLEPWLESAILRSIPLEARDLDSLLRDELPKLRAQMASTLAAGRSMTEARTTDGAEED